MAVITAENASGRVVSMRRERWAWYLYDFGNSAYAAVVLLAIYSAYFKGTVVGGAEGSRLWGYAIGIAMLVVAVISPILGAIADHTGSKKRFLFFFTTLSCIFTATLFFVQRGDIALGMILLIVAEIGYRSAQVFYNALLPEIAGPKEVARVSGIGWAIGSAGGILCLLLILPAIIFVRGALVVRLSLVFTALFFAVSAVPIFFWLKERAPRRALPAGQGYLQVAFGRLGHTIRTAANYREFIKFMISFLIYNDGVIMALDFAAIMGAVLFGLDEQLLILFVILVQVTNVIGAYLFGLLAERVGCKQGLMASILAMIAGVVWLFFAHGVVQFFVIGAVAGAAMAGIQSLSRTMAGVMAPAGRRAEFFGFFAVAGRTSSFIGPAVYGLLAAEAARWLENRGLAVRAAEQMGQRIAILSIGVFLLVGSIMLLFVNERHARGIAQMETENR
ncbi:MAG: MFS transporter [Chloroflexi bacterium]|nr:MFS transporter [Chloroflexota bacterium]